MNKQKEILDKFGEVLMHRVRDEAMQRCDALVSGHLKGERAERLKEVVSNLEGEHSKTAVLALIPEFVDTVLHYFLFTIEEEDIDLVVEDESGHKVNLKSLSDGLAGELYNYDGWIARFSNERHKELE